MIELKDVTKVYGREKKGVKAVENVTFSVFEGEFVSLVGPSGCGKSTIIKMIAGLTRPTSGSVLFEGKEVKGPHRGSIGIVFQDPALLEWRKVLPNVMLPTEIEEEPDKKQYADKAMKLISTTGLAGFEDRFPYELSGGMRQRVALCRALIRDPSLLLMDEPFGALDALTRDQMNVELTRILEKETRTILFVTHSISEAVFLSDRILVMTPRPGKISSTFEVRLERPRRIGMRLTSEFAGLVAQITESLGLEAAPHSE